jgi:AraC-like DNA-binding protein
MRYPLIHSSFLDGFPELVLEKGGEPKTLYEGANLSFEATTGTEMLIPFDRQNQLLDLAAEKLNYPYIGLELARRQTIAIYGPLSSMVIASANLGEALQVFVEHIQLRVQTVKLAVKVQNDIAEFCIESDFPKVAKSVRFQDHGIALVFNLLKTLHGQNLIPRSVYFPHGEVGDPDYYSQYFSCPVAFNSSKLALTFSSSLLSQAIAESARLIPLRLREYLEHRHEDNFVEQVKHCVSLMLVSEECRVDVVAQAIGYSKRTLQRRLESQNTNFKAIVEAVRFQQTEHYINHPYYRLTDIAALLGYSELSAFTRSFKRWYGVSPQQWRKNRTALDSQA